MTNQEMVDKIVEKAGITREQAEQALEMHGGDLLDAMIYVERTYKNGNVFSSSNFSTSANESVFTDSNQQSYNNNDSFNVNEKKSDINGKDFGDTVEKIRNLLINNGIAISYKGKEFVTVPIIVWLILFFSSISSLAALMLITMFFDVSYSFKGNELGNPKINRVMSNIYIFVQSMKTRIFS